jgi:hypothetical protein
MTAMPPYAPPPHGWPPRSPSQVPFRYPHAGYGRSLLAGLVWAGVNLAVIVVLFGPPPSPRAAGAVTGSLVGAALLTGLAVWLIARTRVSGWPFWQLVALALPFFLVLRLVLTAAS